MLSPNLEIHLLLFSCGVLLTGATAAADPEKKAEPAAATRQAPFVNSLGMKFVPVTVGARTLLFSVWETRVADFRAFAQEAGRDLTQPVYALTPAGWKNTHGITWERPSHPQTSVHPVCGVSFVQAEAFCRWLSEKEKLSYRLPTDHEWSCAVGIGEREKATASPQEKSNRLEEIFPWGVAWPPPEDAGNYAGLESKGDVPADWRVISDQWRDGFPRTAPVGSFAANAEGLHDLGGNVFEWCDSGFSSPGDADRTVRGGSWATCEKLYLQSSYRVKAPRTLCVEQYGFRVVLDLE